MACIQSSVSSSITLLRHWPCAFLAEQAARISLCKSCMLVTHSARHTPSVGVLHGAPSSRAVSNSKDMYAARLFA